MLKNKLRKKGVRLRDFKGKKKKSNHARLKPGQLLSKAGQRSLPVSLHAGSGNCAMV